MRNPSSPFPSLAAVLDDPWHRYTTAYRDRRWVTHRDGQRIDSPPDEASA